MNGLGESGTNYPRKQNRERERARLQGADVESAPKETPPLAAF
jgi:hypothetical protein